MGGSPVRLGPFTGGLNTVSDPTAIADVELAECMNLEQDLDGSLKSRPPFKEIAGHVNFTERIIFLCEAVFGADHYLIASNVNGVFFFINGAFTLITNTFEAGAAVQYADKVYLVPKPGSGNGGKWDPSGGFVAVAAIPKGQAAVIHKERLYICPGIKSTVDTSRLKFSDAANFDVWPAGNFIDVKQGDGAKLIDLTVFQDNLLMFKESSTHILSYDTRPDDAVLRPVSDTIGVSRQFNLVNYENQVYILSRGWVYEITNLDFLRINTKVPFVRDDTVPAPFSDEFIFLSLLEDRLVCRFYHKVYIYGLKTRSWSEWESAKDKLHFFGPISTVHPASGREYYSGSCIQSFISAIRFYDQATSQTLEQTLDPDVTISDDFNEIVSNGWGTDDQGHIWTAVGGAASDFSKDGVEGRHTHTAVNVQHSTTLNISVKNIDEVVTFTCPVVATGASILVDFYVRSQGNGDNYLLRFTFNTASNLSYQLFRVQGGVTSIFASTSFGTYSANEKFTVRFRANETNLRVRIWRTITTPPNIWQIDITDSAINLAGNIVIVTNLSTGNTNVLPVAIKFDNLQVGDMIDIVHDIECFVRTKNYDMAISHQFKRLWWWGANIKSNRTVIGTATPITSSFNVTWDNLTNWDVLNTWDQPLSQQSAIETVQSTNLGLLNNSLKFKKSLRYRQINFSLLLVTNGSTSDGPAVLFTMIAWTEVKQIVSRAVS